MVGHLRSFFVPTQGNFRQLMFPHPGEFANLKKKMLMPWVSPGGGWALLKMTDALIMVTSYAHKTRGFHSSLAILQVKSTNIPVSGED